VSKHEKTENRRVKSPLILSDLFAQKKLADRELETILVKKIITDFKL
jgi:hypothetical protein